MRKAQVFSISAIIFTSLLILVSFTLETPDFSEENTVKNYFSNSLESQVRVFNQNLRQNSSVEKMKQSIYTFDRFLNTTSSRKGLDFEAFQAMILPEQEKALFINYRSEGTDFTFQGDTGSSHTVSSLQSIELDVSENRGVFNLTSEELSINQTIKVDGPTLLGYMKISNDRQNWQNYILR